MADGEKKEGIDNPPAATEETEKEAVIENTDAALMWINLDVIKKDIAAKLPPDAVKIVMKRIEKIVKPGFALQAKWFFTMITWLFWDKTGTATNSLLQKEWGLNSVMDSMVDMGAQIWKIQSKLHDTILATMWWEVGTKFSEELAKLEESALNAKKTAKSPWEYRDIVKPLLLQFGASIGAMNMWKKSADETPPAKSDPWKEKDPIATPDKHEWFSEQSHYSAEEQEYVNNVIDEAKQFEWVWYKYGGVGKSGIDCSGLWSTALKKEFKWVWSENFPRLTAALFDRKAEDIKTEEVERGDWMFREDPNWVKRWWKNENGEKIYHIEMTLWKVYERDGAKYVMTYWSSSDAWYILKDWVKQNISNGVWYRERKIDANKHFSKPPYYEKLVVIANQTPPLTATA